MDIGIPVVLDLTVIVMFPSFVVCLPMKQLGGDRDFSKNMKNAENLIECIEFSRVIAKSQCAYS
jgi:hypothetical protein